MAAMAKTMAYGEVNPIAGEKDKEGFEANIIKTRDVDNDSDAINAPYKECMFLEIYTDLHLCSHDIS